MIGRLVINQIIYASRATDAVELTSVEEIVSKARHNNTRSEITGILLYDRGVFIQVLEGEEPVVSSTYGRILVDPRHYDLNVLARRTIGGRSFPRWSMGAASRTGEFADIFERYGLTGPIDPTALLFPSVLALGMEIQDRQGGLTFP